MATKEFDISEKRHQLTKMSYFDKKRTAKACVSPDIAKVKAKRHSTGFLASLTLQDSDNAASSISYSSQNESDKGNIATSMRENYPLEKRRHDKQNLKL